MIAQVSLKPIQYLYIALFVVIVAFDQFFVWNSMSRSNADIFLNTNVAFNVKMYSLLGSIGLLVWLLLLWQRWIKQPSMAMSIWLVVAGGVSNLIDRWVYGGVVDYWHVGSLAFNLADISIVTGVFLTTVFLIKHPT